MNAHSLIQDLTVDSTSNTCEMKTKRHTHEWIHTLIDTVDLTDLIDVLDLYSQIADSMHEHSHCGRKEKIPREIYLTITSIRNFLMFVNKFGQLLSKEMFAVGFILVEWKSEFSVHIVNFISLLFICWISTKWLVCEYPLVKIDHESSKFPLGRSVSIYREYPFLIAIICIHNVWNQSIIRKSRKFVDTVTVTRWLWVCDSGTTSFGL